MDRTTLDEGIDLEYSKNLAQELDQGLRKIQKGGPDAYERKFMLDYFFRLNHFCVVDKSIMNENTVRSAHEDQSLHG